MNAERNTVGSERPSAREIIARGLRRSGVPIPHAVAIDVLEALADNELTITSTAPGDIAAAVEAMTSPRVQVECEVCGTGRLYRASPEEELRAALAVLTGGNRP